ncbi:MAG: hypothetical protein K2Y18_03660 [Alphaproteobacteria bacterium]|nr:hypothetical protein [Alphaproteobacteria bacterium]
MTSKTKDKGPQSRSANLTSRNKALLYALGGFSILLYIISFVRMGQW